RDGRLPGNSQGGCWTGVDRRRARPVSNRLSEHRDQDVGDSVAGGKLRVAEQTPSELNRVLIDDRRGGAVALAGREVEPWHQLLRHRKACERSSGVAVGARAGEPRIDVRLAALLQWPVVL